MVQLTSPPHRARSSAMLRRRHLALFAFLALTTPLFTQVVLGAALSPSSTTTKNPLELLTRPGSAHFRNYHGVVHSEKPGLARVEVSSEQDTQEEPELNEQSSKQKIRMNIEDYPTKDRIPDVEHPLVKKWVSEIDWSLVPNIPMADGLPDAPHFPNCPPDSMVDKSSCWWSCDGCLQPTDVVTCPRKENWGLTYDDGPSTATRDMMQHLNSKQITATFFIVGSRVLEYPDILLEQVDQGHHIAMHTWSHAGLTTLTNQQIVAEIRWSEKIIRDVTGLTMKYIRPPYGDVDNRVREILRQMGYVTVIWSIGWDTNDWRIAMHQIEAPQIINTFMSALDNRGQVRSYMGEPAGPITLEHDLTQGTIGLSKEIIPLGIQNGLTPMSLDRCLNDPYPYQGSAGPAKIGDGKKVLNDTNSATTPSTGNKGSNYSDSHDSSNRHDNSNNSKGATDTLNHVNNDGSLLPDVKDDPNVKSGASSLFLNGLRVLGYAVVGLTAVASCMLGL